MVSFLTATAASRAAQRKFGARSFDDHCSADAEKIERYAYKVTKSEADAQLLIATVYKEAERLVDERWDDIQFVARALERLDDEIEREDSRFFCAASRPSSGVSCTGALSFPAIGNFRDQISTRRAERSMRFYQPARAFVAAIGTVRLMKYLPWAPTTCGWADLTKAPWFWIRTTGAAA
jgi:hypothetical protein